MYYDMKIQRIIQSQVENRMVPGKVVVLLGPRQVGKTTFEPLVGRKWAFELYPIS
jgi:predicted AAA+ superfamily ATPase